MNRPLATLRPNPGISRVVCSLTGEEHRPTHPGRPLALCTCCPPPGRPLVIHYDLGVARRQLEEPPAERAPGLWRHAPLLPVLDPPPSYAGDVGQTLTIRHEALGAAAGVDLLLKNEGSNPSGSFKDRGLAVGVALGAALGAARFCLPTQGNAGVAASLFSARLGLPGCLVYMPEGHRGSLYHRQAELFGAEVRFAGANIAAAGRTMREEVSAALEGGEVVDLSTFYEPGRLEGKKTMGLEIVDDLGPDRLPHWILYPTGGGTGLVGIWKAFTELIALGRLDPARHPLPRMAAVQSESCAPVVESFARGLDQVEPVTSRGTVADGLDVPGAIMGHGILDAIRASAGTAVAVTEAAIVEAFRELGRHGVAASYESAATLAALWRLRGDGTIAQGSRVLLLLTASHLIPLGQGSGRPGPTT